MADMVFPFSTSFSDQSAGSKASSDMTRTNSQFTDTINEVVVDHREVQWVGAKLTRLRFETKEFKRVAQNLLAPRCIPGLYTF